jgi:hypothetical protein
MRSPRSPPTPTPRGDAAQARSPLHGVFPRLYLLIPTRLYTHYCLYFAVLVVRALPCGGSSADKKRGKAVPNHGWMALTRWGYPSEASRRRARRTPSGFTLAKPCEPCFPSAAGLRRGALLHGAGQHDESRPGRGLTFGERPRNRARMLGGGLGAPAPTLVRYPTRSLRCAQEGQTFSPVGLNPRCGQAPRASALC